MRQWIKLEVVFCWTLILGINLLLFSGCYEKQEGCLDVFAENFDFEADTDCCEGVGDDECCCMYPDLSLTVQHQIGDENMVLGNVYLNDRNQPYIINKVSFYMSSIQLYDKIWYNVDESIALTINGQVIEVPDDITRITRQGFQFPVGHFLTPGAYDQVKMSIGLDDDFLAADSSSFIAGHPMYQRDNDLFSDSIGYLLYNIEMIADTATSDTLSFFSPATALSEFVFSVDVEKQRGNDITVNILIDYDQWFRDIDFMKDGPKIINEKIKLGMASSIEPIE